MSSIYLYDSLKLAILFISLWNFFIIKNLISNLYNIDVSLNLPQSIEKLKKMARDTKTTLNNTLNLRCQLG